MEPLERRVREIFDLALAAPPERWPDILDRECESQSLRDRVQRLLHHYAKSADFLAHPLPLSREKSQLPAPEVPIGPSLAEFKIEKELGRGGMGVVYLATDSTLRRTVALKVLSPHAHVSPQASGRFEREALSVARLRHPGIVQIFRYGRDQGFTFMAMEYVDGHTLRALLNAERVSVRPKTRSTSRRKSPTPSGLGPADIVARVRQIADVAEALDHAHNAGIVHRDVKPSNILITPKGKAQVTDFGIAKVVSEATLSDRNEVAGSYPYMSPEQALVSSDPLDRRSDIFSLGVVLYECLTHSRPFPGETPQEILKALTDGKPQPIRSLNPAISKDLAVICHKTLELRVADRYQTAGHLAADLRCFLGGLPILAKPPSAARRLRHTLVRHRFLVAGCLLAATAAVAALSYREVKRIQGEQLAWLTVDGPKNLTAFIQHQDNETLLLGPAAPLVADSSNRATLPPGIYRLSFEDPATARRAEFTLPLLERGSRNATGILLTDGSQPAPSLREKNVVATLARTADLLAGMRPIEAGEYSVGLPGYKSGLNRAQTVKIKAFWIDQHEVSNRDYRAFIQATGRPGPSHWKLLEYTDDLLDRPVICVSLLDAQAYARWRGKRLPTSFEWQAAARGQTGRLYPPGLDPIRPPPQLTPSVDDMYLLLSNDFRDHFNAYQLRTTDVFSPDPLPVADGLLHFFDNVYELTDTIDASTNAVVAGRAWTDPPKLRSLGNFLSGPLDRGSYRTGFRCAISNESAGSQP